MNRLPHDTKIRERAMQCHLKVDVEMVTHKGEPNLDKMAQRNATIVQIHELLLVDGLNWPYPLSSLTRLSYRSLLTKSREEVVFDLLLK